MPLCSICSGHITLCNLKSDKVSGDITEHRNDEIDERRQILAPKLRVRASVLCEDSPKTESA